MVCQNEKQKIGGGLLGNRVLGKVFWLKRNEATGECIRLHDWLPHTAFAWPNHGVRDGRVMWHVQGIEGVHKRFSCRSLTGRHQSEKT